MPSSTRIPSIRPIAPPRISRSNSRDGMFDAESDDETPFLSLYSVDDGATQLRQGRRRVYVQGRLADVRSVSVPRSRRKASAALQKPRGWASCVSLQGVDHGSHFVGYGIGGAGNIRRPTDVAGSPLNTSISTSLSSMFSSSASRSSSSIRTEKRDRLKQKVANVVNGLWRRDRKETGAAVI